MAYLDYLLNSAPGGLLQTPPNGWSVGGLLNAPPIQTTPLPYAAVTPQPQPTAPRPSFNGVLGAVGPRMGDLGSGIVDFLRNNPSTIATLAASLGGAPNMRMGIAQAAGAMPQAQQADIERRSLSSA